MRVLSGRGRSSVEVDLELAVALADVVDGLVLPLDVGGLALRVVVDEQDVGRAVAEGHRARALRLEVRGDVRDVDVHDGSVGVDVRGRGDEVTLAVLDRAAHVEVRHGVVVVLVRLLRVRVHPLDVHTVRQERGADHVAVADGDAQVELDASGVAHLRVVAEADLGADVDVGVAVAVQVDAAGEGEQGQGGEGEGRAGHVSSRSEGIGSGADSRNVSL